MAGSQPSSNPSFLEVLLESFILALRGFVPMFWLMIRVSPIQFMLGGIVLVLVTFIFNPRSRLGADEKNTEPLQGILRDEKSRKERRQKLSVKFDIPV